MKFTCIKILVISCYLLIGTAVQASIEVAQAIKQAVHHPDRLAEDSLKDAKRKPEEILNFFNIAPGDKVLDVLAGSGYYSELLSHVVGSNGKVIIHNDKHFLQYYGEDLAKRLGNGERLANVERMDVSLNDLELQENSLDDIFLILGFHDFYYVFSEAEKIDVTKVLAKFRLFLKPGGTVAVVDHQAEDGAPSSVGGTLHRIDPQLVIEQMTAAGFVMDGESSVLQNNTDDKTKKIWDIANGMTSRFVLKFINSK
jgi:predicted methyltransferase